MELSTSQLIWLLVLAPFILVNLTLLGRGFHGTYRYDVVDAVCLVGEVLALLAVLRVLQ